MSERRDGPGTQDVRAVRDRVRARVVGRERELDLVLAAVAAGRDILLEGPPGTSKSTLLRAITAEWGIPLVFVEGNADLTPAKIVGHHNPARVLREDYSAKNFVDGPLLEAMRGGGFLYIEEFNRAPEDTLNTLLTAMAERRIAVPRAGVVIAKPTFRVIASMNPYDNVGTTRLSTSVHDRLCRLAVSYQDAEAERGIVALRAPLPISPSRCRWHGANWHGFPLVTRGYCCCRIACTTPAPTRGRSRRGCRGWRSCSTPLASRTPTWPAALPGSGAAGSGRSVPTGTWHRPSASSSPPDPIPRNY
jgi:hypothetical protein